MGNVEGLFVFLQHVTVATRKDKNNATMEKKYAALTAAFEAYDWRRLKAGT